MVITTKLDYGDDCWIMHANRPMKGVVSMIQFSDVGKLCAHRVNVLYVIDVLDPNYPGLTLDTIRLHESYVFKTKNECINSLR